MTIAGHKHPVDPLLPALGHALVGTTWEGSSFAPLPDAGLAHHHVALIGSDPPALARIPKQSQLRLDAVSNLSYQSACFAQAAPSGHTPRLFATLQPTATLTRGALIVEHVHGRAADLTEVSAGDVAAIVRALASIHSLSLPRARQPIMSPADPLAELVTEIVAQASFLDGARLDADARALIDRELARLATLVEGPERPSVCLITFDAHPGNFLVRADGEAVLVDLEKCRYSYPSLDLAHATLYTSTTWEPEATAELTPRQIRETLELWGSITGERGAERWHVPLRRLMWLWSVTWCAKWRVLSGEQPSASGDGEDWAAGNNADALADHVRGRVDHYLSAEIVARVTTGFEQL